MYNADLQNSMLVVSDKSAHNWLASLTSSDKKHSEIHHERRMELVSTLVDVGSKLNEIVSKYR